MKTVKFLVATIFASTICTTSYAMPDSPNKVYGENIAKSVTSNGTCYTTSGERGSLQVNSVREVSKTGASNTTNTNSSYSATGTAGVTVGVTKLEGNVSASQSATQGNGQSNTNSGETSRETNYICVPYGRVK